MWKATRSVARVLDETIGWNRVGFVLSLVIIGAAVIVLYRMLDDLDFQEVVDTLRATPVTHMALAALFVTAGYFTLTFYDLFALRTIGRGDVPYRTAALAGFTSYSIGHNLGASVFTGGAVRYRIYSAWGLTAIDVAKVCFVAGLTFWLGNAAMLGLGISAVPQAASSIDHLPLWLNRLVAVAALIAVAAYVVWVWRKPRIIGREGWQVVLPSGPLTLLQIAIGIVDLSCCALAMWILMPEEPHIGFVTLAVIFVSATLLGFASHAPGGLGVFDAAMLVGLWQFDREQLIAGLLLFRLLYYIIPFALALTILGIRELWLNVSKPVAAEPGLRIRLPVVLPMTLGNEPHEGAGRSRLTARASAALIVLVATTIVLGALALIGALLPVHAFAAAVAVAAAALWAGRTRAGVMTTSQSGDAAADIASHAQPLGGWVADILGGLPDPVIALDNDGVVLGFNDRARNVVPALRPGEPASLSLRMPAVVEAVRRASASGEPQRAGFSERVPVDRWYEAHVVPVAVANDSAHRMLLLTLHDLTPFRRMEEMRADFIANASHELRTPLAALSGFIDTLQGAARDDAGARERFLAIMKQQASRMARLIDDLLSLSRIELSAHIEPQTVLELMPIVQQVVDGLQLLAGERQVKVTIAASEPPPVLGDRDELVRVFENLIENALKYGGSGGRVDIAVERSDPVDAEGEVRVSVRDYGPGIAPEHLPRLTERFYRVDVGHSRAEGGTGLGLALVKHILNRHHGRLVIQSVQGEGAAFTVCLPSHRRSP